MDKSTGDPLVGTTIAHYEVVAKVGGGGMGVVYAARDTRLGRRVALKFLPPQWSHDESAKQRFIREAQAASATDHRNICTIHDINETADGQLFIVMAHYDGPTLRQRLESGPLPVDEAIEIAAQIAEGLAKAHAQGVVHRDIKPGNLILTDDGVKILDFGLAKFADARLKLTLEGSTIGTIAYMSPEQARGEEADAGTDVWALGVVLYEMLTGAVPFKGGYPEAIAHAIKTEPPASIRAAGHDIPETLEQLVFRALHKNPVVRFQSVRDLARALRQMQGRTLPLDLRTEPLTLTAPDTGRPGGPASLSRRSNTRTAWVAAAVLAVLLIGTPLWLFAPAARVAVAIAPVVNETGDTTLDAYRLALTHELVAMLSDSRSIRVVPYDRLLQIVRRFRTAGQDVSSGEAIQALATSSGIPGIIVPTLDYEENTWRARIEVLDAKTATTVQTYTIAGVASALSKDAVYDLLPALAQQIEQHFVSTGPRRAAIATSIRDLVGLTPSAPVHRTLLLDTAAALEQGADAYEQQEYSAALRAFTEASKLDPNLALAQAWRSRTARLMGATRDSEEAAGHAARLLDNRVGTSDRLLIEAIVAESQQDLATAEARYGALVDAYPDDPARAMELGAFLDRQARYADAVQSYTAALSLGGARPHLELCRLYGPRRANNSTLAKEHGQLALQAYRALGARAGEGQTLWCLVDVLLVGNPTERAEAARHAEAARGIFAALGYDYNLSRAYNYLAQSAATEGQFSAAAAFWEDALARARASGNAGLQPSVLTNLSVAYEALGNVTRALDYRQQGYTLFETLGDGHRAAQNQANGAFLLIEYGVDPDRGLRDIQNALKVFRTLSDRTFEVFSLRITGVYHRYAGRYGDAEREINQAISVAAGRDLDEEVAEARMDLARVQFDQGRYSAARGLFEQVIPAASGLDRAEAAIHLARTHARLGNEQAAVVALNQATADLETRGPTRLTPLLDLARGEVAYEAGRQGEARAHFLTAASAWRNGFPHEASVEARAYLGLLDGVGGRYEQGLSAVRTSIERARTMGRIALEARSRLFHARIEIARRRFDDALRALNEVPADDDARAIGRELRAQAHYWQGQALAGRGDGNGARAAQDEARRLIDAIRADLPEAERGAFSARPDIKPIG